MRGRDRHLRGERLAERRTEMQRPAESGPFWFGWRLTEHVSQGYKTKTENDPAHFRHSRYKLR